MAFDPTLPPDGANVKAAELRGQFNGLNDKIEAIPAGPPGPQGDPGPQGPQGEQGPPGEVTAQQLDDAVSGTSANSNAVATLDDAFADPDAEALRQRLNEFILAARR